MNITSISRLFFKHRIKSISRYSLHAEEIQREVLAQLLHYNRRTEYGQRFSLGELPSYEAFAATVPVNTYEELKGDIDRMRHGESDILCRGEVKWYAKSSGTTNDKSKFIPVSKECLHDTHYAGGKDAVALYLHANPDSRIFDGKAVILGGSHQPNYNLPKALVGDLSAILIENINPLVNLMRIPSKEIALLPDFEEKRDRIAQIAARANVTNLSGVPSWMMAVLTRVLDITGAKTLDEVWPNLEVFFHGGIAFTPYRQLYKDLIHSDKMHYMETYNASEGFFGLQDNLLDPAMLLMIDYGVFYEFIPLDRLEEGAEAALPLWEVETGVNYALLITTSGGLWRYMIGDTVRFTQTHPYKFVISGRTKSFINAFGEELIVDNAEKGLAQACRETGAQVKEYTAAPIYMNAEGKCRHQWIIEFAQRPADVADFAHRLDLALQAINSDYEAKRYKDITLQELEIIEAPAGTFDAWLKSKGKLGGQHKVPRLSNQRTIIEEVMAMLTLSK